MPVPTGPARDEGFSAAYISGTPAVLALASNPAAGSVLILVVGRKLNGSNTVNVSSVSGCGATWSQWVDTQDGAFGVETDIWVGIGCNGTTNTITISTTNGAATQLVAKVTEWGNVERVEIADSAGGNGNAGTAFTASVANTLGNDLIYYAETQSTTTAATTPTAGYTQLTPKNHATFQLRVQDQYKKATALAAGTQTAGYTSASNPLQWAQGIIVIRGAGPAQHASATLTTHADLTASGTNVIPDNPLPFEMRIYAGDDLLGPAIAILAGARKVKWRDPYNDIGSGEFELAASDPAATTTILAWGNLVRCFVGPFEVFAFWIENVNWTVASPEGDAGNTVAINGRGLEAYLERGRRPLDGTYTSQTAGTILLALMGIGTMPELVRDFTATADSAGNAWSGGLDTITATFNQGSTLLEHLNAMRALGAYAELGRDFVLHVWNSDPGRHMESSVILRAGKHIRGPVQWQQPNSFPCSTIWVHDGGGHTTSVTVAGTGLPETIVGYLNVPYDLGAADTTRTLLGTAEINRRLAAQTSISVPAHHGLGPGEYETFRNYDKGDFVKLDVGGVLGSTTEQIAAIEVEVPDTGFYQPVLQLSAVAPIPLVRLAKQVAALSAP